MPDSTVLDSSAILALLLGEPGGRLVVPHLDEAAVSAVHLSEVHSRLIHLGEPPAAAWERLMALRCEIWPFTEEQARVAAELISITRPYGLSLGDRACIALAMERKAKILTADRVWKQLSLGVEVEVVR
ncbi:type II toxin-antitoxin system VapC family toxin [Terracidiphilus sp.]|uniref:type II toxin-antitoxin system VapC family toxin n=1 Tax=Terracidiphilus sp. TaxID=1964191 RepID=UPI003C25B1D0